MFLSMDGQIVEQIGVFIFVRESYLIIMQIKTFVSNFLVSPFVKSIRFTMLYSFSSTSLHCTIKQKPKIFRDGELKKIPIVSQKTKACCL